MGKTPTRQHDEEKAAKKAAYMREYRQKLSPNTKQQRQLARSEKRRQARLQKRQEELLEQQEKKKKAHAVYKRRYREKKKRQAQQILTPKRRAQRIIDDVESATPRTSQALKSNNISKLKERTAEAEVLNAAKSTAKNKRVRKMFVGELSGSSNKKAASEALGIPRSSFYFKSTKGSKPHTSTETKSIITQFYHRQDISTIYPNKTKSGKVLIVMKYSRKRTYNLFKAAHPSVKTKKSTFDKLKPQQIRLMKSAKYLQCLCDICDNVKLLCVAIKASMLRTNLSAPLFLDNELDLTKETVCSLRNYLCIDRKCQECSPALIKPAFSDWLNDDDHLKIAYLQWKRVSEKVKSKTITKLRKVGCEGQRWELVSQLITLLESFGTHMYYNISQLASFRHCKKELTEEHAAVIVDFAENFVCQEHAEAQSAYYGRNSVTIHPMVMLFSHDSDIQRDSVVMISDDLKHDAHAVYTFFHKLYEHVTLYYPHIKVLHVWSDGASSQYKSKLPVWNIAHNFDLPLKIIWNFYGSRHGKSEADGESAVVKGILGRAIPARELTLTSSVSVVEFLQQEGEYEILVGKSRRHVYHISSSEIVANREQSQESITSLVGIRKLHQLKAGQHNCLHFRRSSCYCVTNECRHDSKNTWQTFYYPG